MTTAFQADAFQTVILAFQIDVVASGGQVPDGRTTLGRKRKTLPYGWWNTKEEAKADIAEAEDALTDAKVEVQTLGQVAPETAAYLRAALWFADASGALAKIEAATQEQARRKLAALEAQVARARAQMLADARDEEEAITLLFTSRF